MSNPLMPTGDFIGELADIAANHLKDMNRLREERARDHAYHLEMMKLIDELNDLKREYRKLALGVDGMEAQFDECLKIIREHSHELSISRDEINKRMHCAYETAIEASPYNVKKADTAQQS